MRILKTLLFVFAFSIAANAFAAGDPKCFKRKKTLVVWYFMGKLEDRYVKIRKGNYFEMYTRFLGLTLLQRVTGNYEQNGDTLHFRFCKDIAPDYPCHSAVLSKDGKTLTFLDDVSMAREASYVIKKDKRRNKTAF